MTGEAQPWLLTGPPRERYWPGVDMVQLSGQAFGIPIWAEARVDDGPFFLQAFTDGECWRVSVVNADAVELATVVTQQPGFPTPPPVIDDPLYEMRIGDAAVLEFDEHGRWIGRCPECHTSHDGHAPGTLGAASACLRAQASALGRDVGEVVGRGLDLIRARRDLALRRWWRDPR